MTDEMTAIVAELPPGSQPRARHGVHRPLLRVRHGMRQSHNWLQLCRFGAVGAAGYVVNLAAFAVCVHLLGIDYHLAAVIAWVVSVLNNFVLNRHWTFSAKQDHPGRQAMRFFLVSLVAFGFTYVVLVALVDAGMMKVAAQAIAIAAGTPLSFVGQKLWSFRA
ncbi:MAG TPA: GtrA family protein [Solirubrobacteraceae bacterium]|nr:GtrA family protein [Solirubrobacteraceae bacterium]